MLSGVSSASGGVRMPAGPVKSVRGAFSVPSLDGIRCVAVLIVFVGHGLTVPGLWPGHLGVTIFFFLSGYLITTLLRREVDRSGRIALGKFYLRRALRILPPAYITIALAVIIGAIGILPSTQNGWGIAAEFLNVTNYYMIWVNSTEGLPPETSMLWSLAVEEHFYLIFPAVLILLLRRRLNYRQIGYILVGACVLAVGWRVFLAAGDPTFYRMYIASDTRFDGLLAGAAMALLWNPALGDRAPFNVPDRVIRFWLSPVAVVTIIAASLLPNVIRLTIADSIIYVALVPLFWLVIVHPEGAVGRVLNHRVVAHIGVLSFSIYLLHRLVIALVELFLDVAPVVDGISLLVTLATAQLMYVAIEKPLGRVRRNLEARFPRTPARA
ncbi:acyltransferase [Microbacterium sp. ZXX196]|uniref:acyltransferase family protein n=1 Tax=Microbacterium sp. ZXX196 TaxID=2609291 RepID=UPI0012B92FB3|nr:acyltransferase [Microbacterium sp. ZXX196]MTE23271.1 acyltransferase family protein [Microbacterium sp. ZXX196]